LKRKEFADSLGLVGGRPEAMMGPRQIDQAALFYEFSLERHVPATHLLRSIDRFVDLSDVRSHLAPFYSSTGRPSIDPELLVRMLLVGYCYGIRWNGGCARRFT
jgi:transposase